MINAENAVCVTCMFHLMVMFSFWLHWRTIRLNLLYDVYGKQTSPSPVTGCRHPTKMGRVKDALHTCTNAVSLRPLIR